MAITIVRLGTQRASDEGLRIGTVRRPPRGVSKEKFASQNWYDIWYPNLAPSAALLKQLHAATSDSQMDVFFKKYRAEMKEADASRTLDLLAALSHQTNFSVGCYCQDQSRCHRSILGALLKSRGACLK